MDINLKGVAAAELEPTELSLERIYPKQFDRKDTSNRQALAIHLQRYRFASKQLQGINILDIACGCGYGTALMAARHSNKQFTGVDIDPLAIEFAQQNYQADNLQFRLGDGTRFPSYINQETKFAPLFDTIVSLETIEHVAEPRQMVSNLLKQLSVNGKMIASVPTTPTMDGNPHHLSDFTRQSFYQLFKDYDFFPSCNFEQIQPWNFTGIFSHKKSVNNRSQGVGRNIIKYYQKNPTALISRIHSILFNGLNNRYLTTCFIKTSRHVRT